MMSVCPEVCRGPGQSGAGVAWAPGAWCPWQLGLPSHSCRLGLLRPPQLEAIKALPPLLAFEGLSGLQSQPHSLSSCPEQTPEYFCISSGKILGGLFMAAAKPHTSVPSLVGTAGNPGPGFRWSWELPDHRFCLLRGAQPSMQDRHGRAGSCLYRWPSLCAHTHTCRHTPDCSRPCGGTVRTTWHREGTV